MNKEKLTLAEGDTSAPEPKQESISEPSSGDETPDSQAGGDISEGRSYVPQARFSEVSRERTRLKGQNAELRNELRRKQIELAIAEKYEGPHRLDTLHRQMFISLVLDWNSVFDLDGVLDAEILHSALREFEAGHGDGYLISTLSGSGSGGNISGGGYQPGHGDSDPWGEPEKRDPYATRKQANREFLSKAYSKEDK